MINATRILQADSRCPASALTLLTALLLAVTAGCAASSSSGASQAIRDADSAHRVTAPENELIIGTAASAPPFIYREGDRIVGLEADLAAELARRLGRPAKLESLYFANLPSVLRNGKADILMAGITITPARQQEMAFTQPYLETGQQIVVRTDQRQQYASPRALNVEGLRIGVERDTTGAAYATHQLNRARIRDYPTVAAAIDALKQRRVDAVVADAPMIAWMVRHDEAGMLSPMPGLLTRESIAWAVRKGDQALLDDANAALAAMKNDGTLDRLIAQWIK